MPVYKVTFVMSSQGYGWTESYYLSTSFSNTLLAIFTNNAQPLINLRIQMMAGDCRIDYCRISTYQVRWSAQVFLVGLQGLYGNPAPGTEGIQSTDPSVAVLLRLAANLPGPSKSTFLRAIPYTCQNGAGYSPTAIFQKALNAFLLGLIGTGQAPQWGWIGVNETAKISVPVVGYTVNAAAPNIYQVIIQTTTNPAGQSPFTNVVAGTKVLVRLSGINGKSQLNGTQVVNVLTPLTCLTKDQFGLIPYSHGGTLTYNTFQFNGIASAQTTRLVTRKAGRQLFLERGRALDRART